jgi:tRNA U34 5-methylaminomethyl-2-thiouridine-forming methyltransferase MnmC
MPPAAPASIVWTETGVPVSQRFGDPYFSRAGGLEEARHVFLAGNGLPGRLRPGFHVAELGVGTGLNLIALALDWAAAGAPGLLRYTGFEAFAMAPSDRARALAAFAGLAEAAAPLVAALDSGAARFQAMGIEAEIVAGDARDTLPHWQGRADAWFLDGFSPAKNPEMWEPALLATVAARTAPGGTFATYSAAGAVRRALQAAGFRVERRPGFAGKRHMTTGRLG